MHMTPKQLVLKMIAELPDDASLEQIRETIAASTNGAVASQTPTARQRLSAAEFAAQPIFGMWSDRSDMADSENWVRQERHKTLSVQVDHG
jgi:hypothetical protein